MGRGVRIMLLVFFMAGALVSVALAEEQALNNDKVQSLEQWLKSFPFEVMGYFCREEMFFMQCFEVSAHECTQVVSTSVDVCLDYIKEQMPESLDRQARELWGAKLISCAGSVYEQALRQRRLFRNNAQCDDPLMWQ